MGKVSKPKSEVEITVKQRPDHTLYFEVTVNGCAKPQSSMVGILEVGKERREEYAIMILAGALAEELCERVNDNLLDPDNVAHAAGRAYRDLKAKHPHIISGSELPRHADRAVSDRLGVVLH